MMESQSYKGLSEATYDEFLPSIGSWSTVGGVVLLTVFGGVLGLAAVLPYRITVKAPVIVRPEGDIRVVEASMQGIVERINVIDNDTVQQGDTIAYLKGNELDLRVQTIGAELEQDQQQLQQIESQLLALNTQTVAETLTAEKTVAAAIAYRDLSLQEYEQLQVTAQTDVREAEASVRFAQDELNRYSKLAETDAVSVLQLSEKKSALEIAQSRLERAQALLAPKQYSVDQANQEVEQAKARGASTFAQLEQERERLSRQQSELKKQLQTSQQNLRQVQFDQKKLALRAPVAGTIQELTLYNRGQVIEPGEVVAQIVPNEALLVFKAQVNQESIGKVEVNQIASIRIDSCIYTDYGVLTGYISKVSPDTERKNQNTSETSSYYEVDIAPQELVLNNGKKECRIQPGMEGRADIITQEETILTAWLRRLRLITNL